MLVWIVAVIGAALGGLWGFQRQLIYLPGGSVPPVAEVLPGWEDAALATDDGLALGAWFRAPQPGAPIVIVFNGNAGNRADRSVLGARLASEGLGVLLVDYRGYGGNPGSPSEAGLAADGRAAVAFVAARAPEHEVVYFGESLGAAVAVGLSLARPPAALVLRSPFTSLGDVASVHYPFLPVRAMLWDEYPSIDRIDDVGAPVLVIAGSSDSIVPIDQSLAIHQAAPDPKQLLVVEGADHNDAALADGNAVVEAVVRFTRDATG